MQPIEPEMSVKVFISYAHKDKALRDQLVEHLTPLKQSGSIAMWYDHDISAGTEWQQSIDEHLNKSHLILLLISPAFMGSDYCYSKEMRRAVERHDAGEARGIPILLRPVDWQKAPFSKLQALPSSAQPITRVRNRDHAFFEVAQAIRAIVEELSIQFATNLQGASAMDSRQTLAPVTLLEMEQRVGSEETGEPSGDEKERPFEGRKVALIVGVNNTRRSSLLPDLKYAEDDAHEIAYTLRTPACNFVCLQTALTGEKAETQAVRRAVIKLAQQRAAQDLLLFYFIGHALPVSTREGRTDIYLVTYDFDEVEATEDASAYLSLRWLQEKLCQSDSLARVLIILDCCYAEKMIHTNSDHSYIDVSQLIKECVAYPSVMEPNGRWKIVLTASTYTRPAQERGITSLLLAVLRGDVQRVLDEWGNVNVHTLYTYLQDEMPLAQLPNLPEDFPQSCILATYHEKSRDYLQQLQQAEENLGWNTVSQIMDQVKVIKDVITDADYFKSLASLNAPLAIQWFDRTIDERVSLLDLNQEKINKFIELSRVQMQDDFSSTASETDQLELFGFLQESHPTYGTLLCFGLNPTRWLAGAFTRCTLWSTNNRHSGWLEAQDYQRDLITQFESSLHFLQKHLRLTRVISQEKRLDALEIPLVALEEALANALVHREYASQTSPVYIDIFYDRLEICSPGDPPEPMTMEALQEEHKSHPRNPQIARVFYLYGHVEKVGSGIQRMQNALKNAHLRPAMFELGKDKTFKVILYRPQQALTSLTAQDSTTIPVTQQDRPLITRRRVLISSAALAVLSSAGAVTWLITRPSAQNTPKPTPTSLQALYNQTIGTTPLMDDPLSEPDNFGWDNYTGQGGNTRCFFSQGQLHTFAKPSFFSPCYARVTNYQNFVLQVKMTIISGHSGGLVFRADYTNDKGYQFRISTDRTYILNRIILDQQGNIQSAGETVTNGLSSFIQQGTNQLAVLAQGDIIALFINRKYVDSVTDSTYHSGQVGVYVDSDASSVEGVFNNLQVWRLPVTHGK